MARVSVTPSLITSWEVSHQLSNQRIEWDILLLPLLFGPVCLLDNMLVDNPGLIEAVRKPRMRALLELYARKGLISLWHRDLYSGNRPVNDIDDLLMFQCQV